MVVRLAVVFAIAALILGPALAAAFTEASLPLARPNAVTVYTISKIDGRAEPAPQKPKSSRRGNKAAQRGYA